MNYGRAIRLIRSARSISQRQLAAQIDADPSLISYIETNKRQPSTETLEHIAQALELPLYLLIFLASDQDDLKGLPHDQAQTFGRELLRLLTEEPDQSHPRGKSPRRGK